ncbi:MAG TPA: ATP-binding protein [Gemmatimonadaceae bacterium]|nr:ATP-binding protein [Gemmatimonadaceae bacterium]
MDHDDGLSTNESAGTSPDAPGLGALNQEATGEGSARGKMARRDAAPANLDLSRLLIDSVVDYAIFVLDPTGHILTWNAGARRLKGWSAEEIIGQSFTRFYPPEVAASGWPQRELEYARRDGRFEDEGWRVRKDGSRFWANVVFTALYAPDGRLVGFAKVTRDLTSRRAAEEQARELAASEAARAEAARRSEELERLNDQLQEQAMELEAQAEELTSQNEELLSISEEQRRTNVALQEAVARAEAAREEAARNAAAAQDAYRELDQFAYVASHDLKAPLRGIANLAQWIEDDLGQHLGAESAEHMRLLQGRVRRMEALIDGILAYSRAGRAPARPEMVDVGQLVRDVLELLAPGESVTTELPEEMPSVEAERVPLQQVFMNLIANAVKFTRAARPDPVVRISWRDTGDAYEFSVTDNGPGIAPQYQDRIWGIFQTLEARDKVEGTGIGLSVVKKIVEARGGRAWVDSSPGQGAVFHFTWLKTVRGSTLP